MISLHTYVSHVEIGPTVKFYEVWGLSWLGVQKVTGRERGKELFATGETLPFSSECVSVWVWQRERERWHPCVHWCTPVMGRRRANGTRPKGYVRLWSQICGQEVKGRAMATQRDGPLRVRHTWKIRKGKRNKSSAFGPLLVSSRCYSGFLPHIKACLQKPQELCGALRSLQQRGVVAYLE